MYKFRDVFEFHKKSKIKAGDGKPEGKYPFYTSSVELNKYVDDYLIDGGSLVFGTGGNASVHFAQNKFAVSTDCLVAQTNTKDVNPKFVYYYLSGNIHILEQGFKGAGLKHISKAYISEITFTKLSRKKQDEIVQILDTADNLAQKRKEQLVLLDDYLKSVFLDMFGDPIINEKGWEVEKLGKICLIRRGASPRPIKNFLGGIVPWIKIGDATKGNDIYIEETNEKIIEAGVLKSILLKKGSFVFANCGVSLGFARILKINGCIHDGWLSFENIKNDINKLFLLKLINQITLYLRGIAPDGTQPNLNTSIMENLDICIPPVDLQNKFVSIVEQVEQTKQKMRASLDEMNDHFNALTQRYFK